MPAHVQTCMSSLPGLNEERKKLPQVESMKTHFLFCFMERIHLKTVGSGYSELENCGLNAPTNRVRTFHSDT